MNYVYSMSNERESQLRLEPEQELKFAQLLINHAVDAAFCVNENSQFLYVNDITCRLSEYSREELLLMSWQDLDQDFSAEAWLQKWRSLKQRGSLTFASGIRTKSGLIFPVNITITYVENQGGEIGCAFARLGSNETPVLNILENAEPPDNTNENLEQEVVEYQKTHTQLAASLSILSSTLESTANGILAVNFEGEILCYNQKFLEMWQLPKSVKLSRKCTKAKEFFESKVKDPEVFRKAIWEMPSNLDNESYDLVELKDGRIFAHYSEPQKLGETIIGRVWSIWDITESKRTEEALKLSEGRFRTLAESTEASIFLIRENHLCYVNPAAEVLTGYTIKELLKDFDLNRLIKTKKLRQVQQKEGEACCQYQEIEIQTKNGQRRWLACTVVTLNGMFDFANQPVELITAIDITDYKFAESEVLQALEQARRLGELRERFVSMFCHQFRTPLNVVSFSADLLKRHIHHWNEEKNRSYLDLIQAAVQQISQLLDDIMLFGRAESAQLDCQPRPLELEQFCRDIVVQMQLASGNQKVIDFVSQCETKIVNLDPKLLQHILTNLLSNAIKYSHNGSLVIFELYCRKEDATFRIEDSGIGIPLVDKQQIFDPFYRGSNVDNIPGTGLGLSIVKTLVDLHCGQISVESEVGAGTTFTVILPTT